MMDRAIWATWYDLPEDGRDGWLDWMHGEYLPGLQSRAGIAWAAHYQSDGGGAGMAQVRSLFPPTEESPDLGTGTQFLQLVAAPEPWTFLSPNVRDVEAAETGRTREMLDRRIGVRPCIFSVFAHIDGPEIGTRAKGTTPAPAIQMGSFRAADLQTEFDAGSWYAQYRLPAMARMPGCVATRVMVSVVGWAKFSVLYEFTSLDARMKNFEERHEALALEEGEWSANVIRRLHHAPGSPTVARRIWPPVD